MDLKISYNWLREYLKGKITVEALARELSLKSMSVERIHEVKPIFSGVITARILEIAKHPNADKLRLPTVDTGNPSTSFRAGEKLQIVCGAPNIEVGQIVPLAHEGAVLGIGTENFTIKKTNIRGVDSNGMLCSPKELGLGDDHSGIMILPPETPIGKKLEEVIPLNDQVLEIEVTSNRPDAMSVLGLAREGAAALGLKFDFKPAKPDLKAAQNMPLSVKVLEPKLCPRYQAAVLTGVKVGPSPLWLQARLLASGLRPINNLVDITNYILLEYGQPLHVFDYEKLAGQEIIVRKAKAGENIMALDGKIYDLKPENMVIADAKAPVAVAGVMGGEESAATEKTKIIVFEAANFNPVSVRKTARALNLHSDASGLYEKGLYPKNTECALLRAIELTQEWAGGKMASKIFDAGVKIDKPLKIKFDLAQVKRYLGAEISLAKVKSILQTLGFSVIGGKVLTVAVPWWRAHDVAADYDLIEEIARLYGYHNLPAVMPAGEIPAGQKDPGFFWESAVKNYLAGLGFCEVYNYSMVSSGLLNKVGFDPKHAVKIANPLNEEMEYMRTTLMAGILKTAADNLNNFSEQKIFELSAVYLPTKDNDLPEELPKLTGALVGGGEEAFLAAKGTVEFLLKKMGIKNWEMKLTDQSCPLWQKGLALDIFLNDKFLGQFGLINDNILEKFGINKPVAVFDFDFKVLASLGSTVKSFLPLPAFPGSSRDLAVVLDEKISWQKISRLMEKINPLVVGVEYLSTFSGESLGEGKKSLALRLVFRAPNRTLKSEEVDGIVKTAVASLEKEFGAKLR